MKVEAQRAVDFGWLVWLRWCAIGGQVATTAVAQLGLKAELPLETLAAIIGVEVATNIAAQVWARGRERASEQAVVALMVIDLLGLTALLYFTGGPYNPFNFLYLVYIALGSVVLRARWTAGLALLASLLFGALFVDHVSLRFAPDARFDPMQMHVEGMWVGFVVAAVFIVYFVGRVRAALVRREAELAAAREAASRAEQLAALGTLAAGAAHELGTPLATIALAAEELELEMTATAQAEALVDDVRLIRGEVRRCRDVLSQLAIDVGHGAGGALERVRVRALIEAAAGPEALAQGRITLRCDDASVRTFARLVVQALRGVIANALRVAPPDQPVTIDAHVEGRRLRIVVTDLGDGMPPDVLRRATDPFFTTRPAGQGMGLGLFLTRTIVDRLGGDLAITSSPGAGTTVTLNLPIEEGPAPSLTALPAAPHLQEDPSHG